MDGKIEYLNTDLDLTSATDLAALAEVFESHGVGALHLTHGEDGLWYATFETDEQFDEPEKSIAVMVSAIEALPPAENATWCSCSRREFNIGYDCGDEPWAFNQALSSELLGRIAKTGALMRITLYPPERKPES